MLNYQQQHSQQEKSERRGKKFVVRAQKSFGSHILLTIPFLFPLFHHNRSGGVKEEDVKKDYQEGERRKREKNKGGKRGILGAFERKIMRKESVR